ncbi:MAG: zinc ribbon domain-containing protein, partial [Acidobacteriia bacterium]|nr:zinc ribbon domain-containing protein [Terriglobia bacterium]
QEYWRPALDDERPQEHRRAVSPSTTACAECGADLAAGARFCPTCGAERDSRRVHVAAGRGTAAGWLDFQQIKSAFGLSTGSLLAFFAGMICAVAAIATGFVFSATTLVDWQAVQVWRVEWLLAAITAMLVGLLLKK